MESLKPTYEFYKSWGGVLDEETYQTALPQAFARVKQRCAAINLLTLSEDEASAFKNAVCAACDVLSDDTAGLSSYSAGSISATYSDTTARANTVGAAIERELSHTRLISAVI